MYDVIYQGYQHLSNATQGSHFCFCQCYIQECPCLSRILGCSFSKWKHSNVKMNPTQYLTHTHTKPTVQPFRNWVYLLFSIITVSKSQTL